MDGKYFLNQSREQRKKPKQPPWGGEGGRSSWWNTSLLNLLSLEGDQSAVHTCYAMLCFPL
jgi:hypothetical protein